MKNLKAFLRIMYVFDGKYDITVAHFSKESKTPVATVRELLDFALNKEYIYQEVKDHKIVYNIASNGRNFLTMVDSYKDIFVGDEE